MHEYFYEKQIKLRTQLFINSSNVCDDCQLPLAQSVFKQCSECPPASETHNGSLLKMIRLL